MPKFSDRLKQLRIEYGFSQQALADKLGCISKSSINMYERGEREPGLELFEAIADLFNVDMDFLLGKSDIQNRSKANTVLSDNIIPVPEMKEWRVLGATACGTPLYREIDDETIIAPANIDADFVFRCAGDSMIGARILDGDIVFVKSGEFVEDGQIAVVRIGEEYALKRIYRGIDYLELRSENPMYPPQIIRGEQENGEMVGRAVHFLSKII